ncbi:diguanylate cyclase [Dehalobacter sp. DCM]|uniref:bifunctional diguanylate cyclase/phosphohydrolase n=1 Tax=Dehalobacter sp. DCM TaxID=2907827 RepID=UPI0030816F8C|nr:diguanylate cyclase [Dehalobacter sp. DCM]
MEPESIILASCTVTVALLISYSYLYLTEKKIYIISWILSLVLLLTAYVTRYYIIEDVSVRPVLSILNYFATVAGYWLLYNGVRQFFKASVSRLMIIGAILLFGFFTAFTLAEIPTTVILLVTLIYTITLLVTIAYTALTETKPDGMLKRILGCIFFIWAVALFLYPLCVIWNYVPYAIGYWVVGIIGLIAFIGMQALYFQRIRQELENKEAKIRQLVEFDKLTGAYSRTYFEHALDDFLERISSPAVLAMGDINGLKLINDTFGHEKGDELLLDGATVIKNSLGQDNIVVRWGGDEFIVIMPYKTMLQAEATIRDIKSNLKTFRPKTIPLEISFGLAAFDPKQQSIYECIKIAEELMYNHKLLESQKTRMNMIAFLEKLLWEKDYQTEAHVMRIKSLADKIGVRIGLSSRELVELNQVAMLHDIGKIGVPVEVLRKRSELTPEEWAMMKKHTDIGYRITQSIRELSYISDAILSHHECWDGSGYPQGLKGQEIPLYSRIVAIVDSYDVITHERPYKHATDHESALLEINACAGTQFDPYLVDVFTLYMEEAKAANDY